MDPATIAAVVSGLGLAGTGLNSWLSNRGKLKTEEVKATLDEKNSNFNHSLELVSVLRQQVNDLLVETRALRQELRDSRAESALLNKRIFELEHPARQ